jgi:hypothetical protein
MNRMIGKTWWRFGMAGAMTVLLGLGECVTATRAHALDEKFNGINHARSLAGRSGAQARARNLANIINPGELFTAPGDFVILWTPEALEQGPIITRLETIRFAASPVIVRKALRYGSGIRVARSLVSSGKVARLLGEDETPEVAAAALR